MAIPRSRINPPSEIWTKIRKSEQRDGCLQFWTPRARGNYTQLSCDCCLTNVGPYRKSAVPWYQESTVGVLDR